MRTAILSDIHGNSPALRAVLADVRQAGCERLLVLGDVIAGYDPAGCLDLLADWSDSLCIQGNAEAYLLTLDRDIFPEASDEFYLEFFTLLDWFRAQLSIEQFASLRLWPDSLLMEGAILVHDHPLDRLFPQRWWKPGLADKYQEIYFHSPGLGLSTPAQKYVEVDSWMGESGTGLVFIGHTHVPFIRETEHGIICNAGSVGTPLDGVPHPSWVLAEGRLERGCRLEMRRVVYDLREYTTMITAKQDNPDWRIPGRAQAYLRMVETGEHWKAFMPPTLREKG